MGMSIASLLTACCVVLVVVVQARWSSAFDPGPVPFARTAQRSENGSHYRLPTDIVPVSYDILVSPDLGPVDNQSMDGRVIMTFNVTRPTKNIFLHGLDIKIVGNPVVEDLSSTGGNVPVLKVKPEPEREMFNIELEKSLERDHQYTVDVNYTAVLATWMGGFYKASYVSNSTRRYLMASQLQATLARRAFPCMDEPHLKATFHIKVSTMPEFVAISNMPRQKWDKVNGRNLFTFDPTPPMSTYLVAVVVSDLGKRDIITAPDDPNQAIWGREDALKGEENLFAADVAPKILKTLEEWTNISFALRRLHHIAVPEKAGAMENWGLITYAEDYLLLGCNASENARQSVLTVIAHETAHQWFGNLVSPLRWDYTWLSEGFANYMQHFIADKVKPSWKVMEQIIEKTQSAMEADVLPDSFPLTQIVDSPEDILAHFGRLTYNKGASIIRMAEHILGEDVFRAGIIKYLKQNNLATGTPQSLFKSWETAAKEAKLDVDITGTISAYTTTTGYPILHVERDYALGTVIVRQTPFPGSPNDTVWTVPLSVAWEKQESFSTKPIDWLPPLRSEYKLNITVPDVSWIIFNPNQTGYYRVKYTEGNYRNLARELSSGSSAIPAQTRSMLLDDAWSLWRAKELSLKPAFMLTLSLKKERDLLPWKTAQRHLQWLLKLHKGSQNGDTLQEMMVDILSPWYNAMGFEIKWNEDHLTLLARELALPWACRLGLSGCRAKATEALNKWITNGSYHDVPLYWESAVWCAAAQVASDREWDFLQAKAQESTDVNSRQTLLNALACSTRNDRLTRLLDLNSTSLDSYHVVFAAVCNSPSSVGPDTAWTYLRDHFDDILSKYGQETMANIILELRNTLTVSEYRLKEFSGLRDHVGNISEKLDQAFSTASKYLRQRLELVQHQAAELRENLREWRYSTLGGAATRGAPPGAATLTVALLSALAGVRWAS